MSEIKVTPEVLVNPDVDASIHPTVDYFITEPDSKHYLSVDAYYGTSQQTAFVNAYGNTINITNGNNDSNLGLGKDLVGKSIKVRTRAFGDLDDTGVERVRVEFTIDDQSQPVLINRYDKSEDEDDAPFLKFTINFKEEDK